jgi:diaminopimelate decarboxylase
MTLADLLPSLRTSLAAHLTPGLWPATAHADCAGELTVGGLALSALAARHGTPCTVLDLDEVRGRCREYRRALPGVELVQDAALLAGPATAALVRRERLGLLAGSAAVARSALAAGFPRGRVVLRPGDADLTGAACAGRVVVDAPGQLPAPRWLVDGRRPEVLLVAGDRAPEAARRALAAGLRLTGLHLDLGAGVRTVAGHERAVREAVELLARLHRDLGWQATRLQLDGGHPVPMAPGDTALDLACWADRVPWTLAQSCRAHGLTPPGLTVLPGAALVGPAGVAVHRVRAVRRRTGEPLVVTLDGPPPGGAPGMRTARLLGRAALARPVPALVLSGGRDAVPLAEAALPEDTAPGDLVALPAAGAGDARVGVAAGRQRALVPAAHHTHHPAAAA